jgi:hypothetical protein
MCGLWRLVIVIGVAGWSIGAVFAASGSRASPSPTPAPSPPVIELLAVPNHEVVKRKEHVEVSLLISNKSDKPVQVLDVSLAGNNTAGQDAPFTGSLAINSEVKPFTSEPRVLTITTTDNAPFTQSKLLLLLRYSWNAGKEPVTSTQTATVAITVQRPFEEEAQGFPGGTAAFLYFLLPIIPALLSYQLLERYRKGEGWKVPTFSSDQIVPAFLLAVVLSFVIVAVGKSKGGINYSNPKVFASVLGISLAVGALLPIGKLLRDNYRNQTWGFTDNDSGPDYLRKALLSPWTPPKFEWVTGKVGRVTWQGILLEQPSGAKVLGATVQIFPGEGMNDERYNTLKEELFDGEVIRNRQRLVDVVTAGELLVGVYQPIERGSNALPNFVAVGQVKGFQQSDIEVRNLFRPLT